MDLAKSIGGLDGGCLKLNGHIAATALDQHRDLAHILGDRLDHAHITFKQTADNLYVVTDCKGQANLLDLLNVESLDLSLAQGSGAGSGAHETGHTRNVADGVPRFVGHDHLDVDVAGENLDLYRFLDVAVFPANSAPVSFIFDLI